MNQNDRLDELLRRWQADREQGSNPTPEQICGECPELLAAFRERANARLSTEAADTVDVTRDHAEQPTTLPMVPEAPAGAPHIPGYRITGEIARGGMGQVWAAVDLELEREVAVKTLLSIAHAERFVTEAKITAQLPHPGIPPVHRLGRLADGTSFLAMKLIRGRTLAALLAERVSPQDQLSRYVHVFEQICQAVGFAHSRQIIHRDLKPLNVMVGEFGEVQVMDWGLAKEMRGGESGLRSEQPTAGSQVEMTQLGAVMGTPSYMPPEQARGEVVDQRADVFALGSILAAILTGQPAFVGRTSHETIAKAAAAELADVMSRLGECAADAELVVLARQCVSADRGARPADANAVAAAVTSYRQGVEARLRHAETERAEALVRDAEQRKRRRVVRWAAALVATFLVAGILGTSYGLLRANRALAAEARQAILEREAKVQANQKREEAEAASRIEQQERKYAQAISDFVRNDFLALTTVEGQYRFGEADDKLDKDATLRQLLDRAAASLDQRTDLAPRIEAELRWMIGVSYRSVGESDAAIRHLERCVSIRHDIYGPDASETLSAMNSLGVAYVSAEQFDLAVPLCEKVLELVQAKRGPEHPDTATELNNLAIAYRSAGKLDLALPLLEQSLRLLRARPEPLDTHMLGTMSNLAAAYNEAGKVDLALPLQVEALKLMREVLGQEHPVTFTAMNNLAEAYRSAGMHELALPLLDETLKVRRAKLGEEHPETLVSMNNLAEAYRSAERLDLALPLIQATVKLRREQLGPEHPDTLSSTNNLALVYQDSGKHDLAQPLFEESVKVFQKVQGPEHPDTLNAMGNLAGSYLLQGKPDLALPLFETTLAGMRARLSPDHPKTLNVMNSLAYLYITTGKLDLALPLLNETLELKRSKLGADHPDTLGTMGNLAHAYLRAKEYDRAAAVFEEFLAGARRRSANNPVGFATLLSSVSLNLFKVGQFAAAETFLREALAIRQEKLPDHWSLFATKSLLGATLAGQRKFAEAEPLLIDGYEGMQARAGKIPAENKVFVTESLDRLIELYTAWEKPAEADKWKAQRDG